MQSLDEAGCTATPQPRTTRRLWVVLALTGGFMLVEAAGGYVSGSLALLADAGHMLTDVAAIGLSLFSAGMARRPADVNRTYGYLRYEILAALVNGAALLGLTVWIVIEAIHRIGSPHPVRGWIFLAVASAGLLVNLIGVALMHGISRANLNSRGVYLHLLGDALGSVGALLAAGIILVTGWTLADPIVSVAISGLIVVGAWRLVRESVDVLLESVPPGVSLREVRRRVLAVDGVSGVHDLHVWMVGSGMVAMSGHAVVPDLQAHPDVLEEIRSGMGDLGIDHVTVQIEVEHRCEEPAEHHARKVG